MKTLYKNILLFFILMIAVSCSQELSYTEALEKNRERFDDPQMVEDARFLVDAKSANMLEIRLTQMAADSGYASAVVDLARQNLNDHQELSEDLEDLARKKRVKLPTMMSNEHQSLVHKVASSDREDFDENFMDALQKVNKSLYEDFMDKATEANDADIRAFAARKLDVVRAHSDRIDNVQSKLLSTY